MKNKRKLMVSILAGIMAAILLFGLIGGVLPYFAGAKSSSTIKNELNKLQDQKKEIDAQIKELEKQLSANLDDMEAIVEQKNTIDQQIFMLHEKVNNINEQITTYTSMIADKQEELDAAELRLAELNAKNKERIRAMEEEGELSYWSVLFKASSFSDLLDRMNMIREIAAADQRRMKEMSDAAKVVAETKQALEVERAALEQTKTELEESQVEMEAKREEADKLLADLIATGDEFEKLMAEAEEAVKDLNSEIKDKKEEYEDAKDKENASSSGSGSNGDDYVPSKAKWLVPCKYKKFTSPYGWRIHPVYNERRFHYGVDLANSKGTPIVATRDGTVTVATYNKSAGYYVEVDHGDGFSSQYMHMTHYIVKKGDKVKAGEVVGYMGSTGVSTGSHLHFNILYKGKHVNPAKYIDI